MRGNIIIILCLLCLFTISAQEMPALKRSETLRYADLVNDYFMRTYPDVGATSHVGGKTRNSRIWTRGVYYEGLMAFYREYPQEKCLKYAVDWGKFHNWKTTDGSSGQSRHADFQCCGQAYLDLYMLDPVAERKAHAKQIFDAIKIYPAKWIIWTGGEPTIQLMDKHLRYFKEKGYKQAIETNGTNPVPSLIDYITCSPKSNYPKVKQSVPCADEVRIPLKVGDELPDTGSLPVARKYFVSPVFDGGKMNKENVAYCVELVKNNPGWALSLQIHKLIDIE